VVDCVSVVVEVVTGSGGGAAICVFVTLDFVTPLASWVVLDLLYFESP
jgi:hypothetical protein